MSKSKKNKSKSKYADKPYWIQYNSKKQSARSKKISFQLSYNQYEELRKQTTCWFTGVELTDRTYSLDRVDNKQGYTASNTRPCHRAFNHSKGAMEGLIINNNDMPAYTACKGVCKWFIQMYTKRKIESLYCAIVSINHQIAI